MKKVPFSTFKGYLKCIRSHVLSDSQQAAMRLAFPGFYEEPKANPRDIESYALKQQDSSSLPGELQTPFSYRRFSGGPDLPRARYYSICLDGSGHDYQTLASELMGYMEPSQSGEVTVLDLSDPNLKNICDYYRSLWPRAGVFEKTIVAIFKSRPGIPNPFVEKHSELIGEPTGKMKEVMQAIPVFFPTDVVFESIPNCIDLRQPNVQAWLNQEIRNGIPNVFFVYSDIGVRKELVLDELSRSNLAHVFRNPHEDTIPGTDTSIRYTSFPDGKKVLTGTNGTFTDLLPLLMCYVRGGSPVTDAIAVWLRRLGANALIFPSSRTDPYCKIVNGKLDTARGFNLVDFRGSSVPPLTARMIEEPATWAVVKYGVTLNCGVPGGIFDGSWHISGNFNSTISLTKYEAELYYQKHYNDINKDNLRIKIYVQRGEKLVGPLMISEVKAMLAINQISLSNFVKYAEEELNKIENKCIGQFLASVKQPAIEDYLEKEINWGGSWFLHQWGKWDDEILLCCPVCDYKALYPFSRGYSIYSECPACKFSNGTLEKPEIIHLRIQEQSIIHNQKRNSRK